MQLIDGSAGTPEASPARVAARATTIGTSIFETLAAATCALVGVSAGLAHAGEINSAVLLYSEASRVTVLEGVAKGRREIGGSGQALGFHLTLDALTGASANGATPASNVQTFTSPSGRSSYTTLAGETPLNTNFRDTRIAGGFSWEQPLGRLSKGTGGIDLSWETDYTSLGLSGTFAHDLFHRNTTLVAGASGSWDRVSPTGGVPIAGSSMPPPNPEQEDDKWADDDDDERSSGGSSESKTTVDFLGGITQVLDRSTVLQLNYTHSRSLGYLTDPYKLVSVFAAGSATQPVDPIGYRFESRPDSRAKNALFSEVKHHFSHDVVNLSYRYLWDDWGVRSHTVDARYRWERAGPHYWEPHARYYRQSAADVFVPFVIDGDLPSAYFSADYRLGEMAAYSAGLKRGWVLESGRSVGVRLEYYEQHVDGPQWSSPLELYPTVRAVISQIDYSFNW